MAQIELLQPTEKIKDSYGKINDAISSLNSATSAATPNTIVQRDADGRFKASAPVAADDVARKAEVDGLVETGTFTPFVYGSTIAGTLSYNPQTSGRYKKIQNIIFVEGTVRTDGPAIVQPTGNLLIGGLPYVIRAETGNPRSPAFAISALVRIKLPTNGYMIVLEGAQGQSVIRLWAVVDNNEMAFVLADDQSFTNAWHIRFSGWYETN